MTGQTLISCCNSCKRAWHAGVHIMVGISWSFSLCCDSNCLRISCQRPICTSKYERYLEEKEKRLMIVLNLPVVVGALSCSNVGTQLVCSLTLICWCQQIWERNRRTDAFLISLLLCYVTAHLTHTVGKATMLVDMQHTARCHQQLLLTHNNTACTVNAVQLEWWLWPVHQGWVA